MKALQFNDLLNNIKELTLPEREALSQLLGEVNEEQKVYDMIERRFKEQDCCPHCGEVKYYRHGFSHGLQRYRCQSCKTTFNALTGTPLARLRNKERWFSFLETIINANSVRYAAKKLEVSKTTSFLWRHRFLTFIKDDKATELSGITEADETYFLHSEKGNRNLNRKARKRGGKASKRGLSKQQVCVLVARDRTGNTTDFITGRGNMSAARLSKCLSPVLKKDAVLVSDGGRAFKRFAQDTGLTHEVVDASKKQRVRGAFHVQNINAYHSRLKNWIGQFNGVATKYLDSYLGWRRSLDCHKNITPELLLLSALGSFNS